MKRNRYPWCSLLLILAAGILAALSGSGTLLEFDREEILIGHQWWRLVTGHLVHWSAEHLLWDALAVLLAGSILEAFSSECRSRAATAWWLLAGAIATSLGTLFFFPEMLRYRGLSGLAVQLFTVSAMLLLIRGVRSSSTLEILSGAAGVSILFGKMAGEYILGQAFFVSGADTNFTVAVHAHLIAAVVATAWALCLSRGMRRRVQ